MGEITLMCAPTQADLSKLMNQKLKQVAELKQQIQVLEAEIEALKSRIKHGPAHI